MWHKVFYPSSLDFVIPLPFTISWRLGKYALERIRSGWKLGCGLIRAMAPSGSGQKRAALRPRVAFGSAGGTCGSKGGSETGEAWLGPQRGSAET